MYEIIYVKIIERKSPSTNLIVLTIVTSGTVIRHKVATFNDSILKFFMSSFNASIDYIDMNPFSLSIVFIFSIEWEHDLIDTVQIP